MAIFPIRRMLPGSLSINIRYVRLRRSGERDSHHRWRYSVPQAPRIRHDSPTPNQLTP